MTAKLKRFKRVYYFRGDWENGGPLMTAKLKRFKRVYYFRGDWENGFFALWLWPFAMGITLLSAAFILHPVGPALISSMVKFLCSFFFSAIACYVWYHTFKLFYAFFCQFKAYYEEVKE